MLREAALLGDVIVLLNSDRFLLTKKGKKFMCYEDRKDVLEAIRYVSRVVRVIDDDQTVCETLRLVKPDIFVNGGDRTEYNTPEMDVCEELGIEMRFNVGGNNGMSSSILLENYAKD